MDTLQDAARDQVAVRLPVVYYAPTTIADLS